MSDDAPKPYTEEELLLATVRALAAERAARKRAERELKVALRNEHDLAARNEELIDEREKAEREREFRARVVAWLRDPSVITAGLAWAADKLEQEKAP